jgi:glycosyltransferase involved in cell wall biosynthesis
MTTSAPRIAYLLNRFPKLSETFVLNEVVNLQLAGLDIVPISLERSSKLEQAHHPAAGRLRGQVLYPADGFPFAHARATLEWLLHRPLALAKLVIANHRLPAPRGESRAARLAIAVRAGTLLRRNEIEHVHAHWSYPADVAYLLAPLLGLSVSLTAHAHDIYEDIPLYEQHGLPYSRRAQQARFVVTCTSTNYEHIRALLPEALRERIHLVYHGLDLSHFAPNGVVPVEPPLIVTVGRQVWCKGFDVVIGAARILRDNGRSFRCAIVGPAGPETNQLNGLIDDYDLRDRVELVGPRRQDELRDLYREATVFTNASWPEGEFGVANVIVEALATGLPVVVTDRPHVREYVEAGVSGLYVQAGDAEELAEKLARVLDDPELRTGLAREGREVAKRVFDIRDATESLLGLFRSTAVARS